MIARSPTWQLGPLRISTAGARGAGIASGIVALAGGLLLGVATAVDPGTALASPVVASGPGGPAAQTAPVSPSAPRPDAPLAPLAKAAPRAPLHAVVAAKLGDKQAQQPAPLPAQRTIVGRVVSIGNGVATVQTTAHQVFTVHATAQTRLPPKPIRAGEQVVVIGRPGPNDTFLAQVVLRRPAAK